MKVFIAFAVGTWFGFFVCAILSVNKHNEYERQHEYDENSLPDNSSHK